jgi:hypothetical protein
MKTVILKFGLYAAACQIVLLIFSHLFIWLSKSDYDVQEIVGYATILASLSFVYFGIRYYRDRVNGGNISFLKALAIGLLIVLIPSVSFGLTNTLYVLLFDPHFYEKYAAHELEQMRKSVPVAQLPASMKEMKKEVEFYKNPLVGFAVMFFTVAALGTVITLLSALILTRTKKATNSPSYAEKPISTIQ